MAKPRELLPSDREVLQLVRAAPQAVTLMPVVFNGEQRHALVLTMQNSEGAFVRMLAILPVPEDNITNIEGESPSFSPPVASRRLN